VDDWLPLKAGGHSSPAERLGWMVVVDWLQDVRAPDDCFPDESVPDDWLAVAWADSTVVSLGDCWDAQDPRHSADCWERVDSQVD